MKSLVRTRVLGGSLVVTIPKEIVREEDIREGELLQIEVEKVSRSFFGVAKGMTSFTKDDEAKFHD